MENKIEEPLFEFDGELIEFYELTRKQENELNSYLGAKGAICMDNKTKIIEEKIDYGPIKDIAGNIIEPLPVDEKLLKKVNGQFEEPKKFVRNSIFH
jgi:hypothetical protein